LFDLFLINLKKLFFSGKIDFFNIFLFLKNLLLLK